MKQWKYRFSKLIARPLMVERDQYVKIVNAITELQDSPAVPDGGNTFEVLQKNSSRDGDATWGPVRSI